MGEIAGWVAPIATAVAAIMTASNLGTRVTGWGFVVFTVGSLAWIAVAVASGQTNLLLTNAFLTMVNMVGIWRWLGRQAAYDKGARAAEVESGRIYGPDLFQLGSLSGKSVTDRSGETVGHIVDAMAECATGHISYFVVREGSEASVNERLRALPWKGATVDHEAVRLKTASGLSSFAEIDPTHWPSRVEPRAGFRKDRG